MQTSVKIDSSGVTINAPTAQVQVTAAASMTVNAPQLTVNAGISNFNGIVKCMMVDAAIVKGVVYTPGIGNIW
jgi:hypothetical protein